MSNLLVYPLDTVTTRMQTSKGRSNLVSAFKRMVREEGISSFYKGLGSDTLSTAISQFVFFYAYSLLHKGFLRHKTRTAARATVGDKASPPILSALEGLLVGCLAGLVAKGIVAPLSNVTVRQQTSSSAKAKAEDAEKKAGAAGEEDSDDEDGDYSSAPGITEIVRDILKEQGWTGLWSGYKSAIVLVSRRRFSFGARCAESTISDHQPSYHLLHVRPSQATLYPCQAPRAPIGHPDLPQRSHRLVHRLRHHVPSYSLKGSSLWHILSPCTIC